MKKILLVCLLLLATALSAKTKEYTLTSPDGHLSAHIVVGKTLQYDLRLDNRQLLLPTEIDLATMQEGAGLFASAGHHRLLSYRRTNGDMKVASPFTRQDTMRDHYNGCILQFDGGWRVEFRIYDEGFAYRLCYNGHTPIDIQREGVALHCPKDYGTWVPYVSQYSKENPDIQYSTSFENLYTHTSLSQMQHDRLAFLPLLLDCGEGVKICISETHLENYPGLYLYDGSGNSLRGTHARLPKRVEQGGHNNLQLLVKEREQHIAHVEGAKDLPWRLFMVSREDRQLAANNLSYLLAAPSRIDDLSWVKPGKVAWDWWNDWNIEGVDFASGINNDTYKHYIDFASKQGIEYVILDEGWAVNRQADLLQVVPDIDLPLLVRYAAERNVGIILWAGYYAFERNMEQVCRHYSEMGVKGFKIDFMDRDDQLMTDFYYRAAASCAKYRLVVDFHGAFKPAGLNRTYPNVLNFEGVAGLEQLKWAPDTWNQVQYDTELPFIRQTAGPMDYTQGAMQNAARGCYHPCWSDPMSQGTRCHQLGLYIVLESPLTMLCDSPTRYMREGECTQLIASIPTVWDETRIVEGEVGEYIVTARRKGNTWYLGGITNWTPRDITLDLTPFGTNNTANLYIDGPNAHRKGTDYRHLTAVAEKTTIHMAPGGGFVLVLDETANNPSDKKITP